MPSVASRSTRLSRWRVTSKSVPLSCTGCAFAASSGASLRTAAAVLSGSGAFSARAKTADNITHAANQREKSCHRAITDGNVFSFPLMAT